MRALAISAVVIFHSGVNGLPGGFLGVDVFFVVSGYLITSLLLEELSLHGSIDIGRFYFRRVRRLYPALIAMAAVVTVIATLFTTDASAPTWRDLPAALLGLTNWWLVAHQQNYFEVFGRPPLLQHTGSLAVEAQFYLFWPILLICTIRLLGRRALTAVTATLVLAVTATIVIIVIRAHFNASENESHFFYGTDTRSIGLVIGALLAALLQERGSGNSGRAPVIRDVAGATALLCLVALFHYTDSKNGIFFGFSFLATSVATATLIACVLHPESRMAAALSIGLVRWIGTRSYSIYLWHWPIFQFLRPGYEVPLESVAANLFRIAVTLLVAEIAFRVVEQPLRRFRLSQAMQLIDGDDWSTRFALCSCICFAIVSGGLLHLMAIQRGDEVEAAMLAMLQKPVLRPRLRHQPPSRPATVDARAIRIKRGVMNVETTAGLTTPLVTARVTNASIPSLVRLRSIPATTTLKRHAEASIPLSRHIANGKPLPPHLTRPRIAAQYQSVRAAITPLKRHQEPPGRIAYGALPIEREETTLLGDSIMLAASRAIAARFNVVNIDAVVSRQAIVLAAVVARLHAAGRLTPVVILDLGNNGTVDVETLQGMLRELSSCDRVVIVNAHVPRLWEAEANETIARVAANYNNTVIADWHDAANGHAEYFGDDRVHPNDVGARAYTDAIVAAIAAAPSNVTT